MKKNSKTKNQVSIYDKMGNEVYEFFFETAKKNGYEFRSGQADMACDIVDALKLGKHITIEAGVGIGKSFAYSVPAILVSEAFDRPVIIATSTIALQEQLRSDIRQIESAVRRRREVLLIKGMNHYLCRQRLKECLEEESVDWKLFGESIADIRNLLDANKIQERSDFDFQISNEIWKSICVNKIDRRCQQCKYGRKFSCEYINLRKRLQFTDGIVICNIDLVINDLRKRKDGQREFINSGFKALIIDEAHNLEDKVRSSYTHGIRLRYIKRVLDRCDETFHVTGSDISPYVRESIELLNKIKQVIVAQIKQQKKRFPEDDIDRFKYQGDMNLWKRLKNSVNIINQTLDLHSGDYGNNVSDSLTDSLNACYNYINIFAAEDSNYLCWVAVEANYGDYSINCCPKDVATICNKLFFSDKKFQTICTSATLTTEPDGENEDRYQYFADNIGFTLGNILSDPKESPFSYDKHSMIYYASDLPHPRKEREEFLNAAIERLIELISISDGKALILFTSKADMECVFKRLQHLERNILIQRGNSGQQKLVNEFKQDPSSVLLGTGLWEGISIEGSTLSHVIIFKLPFPIPDPVIDYKCECSNDKMDEVLVPEMILKLKQGVGRLIRNYDDKGIVSILDPRLGGSWPYIQKIWDSLPVKNRTNNLKDIKEFYAELFKE